MNLVVESSHLAKWLRILTNYESFCKDVSRQKKLLDFLKTIKIDSNFLKCLTKGNKFWEGVNMIWQP